MNSGRMQLIRDSRFDLIHCILGYVSNLSFGMYEVEYEI